MSWPCWYASGTCTHEACGEANGRLPSQLAPTEQDYCAGGGHEFYGWEWDPADAPPEALAILGRCWCGERRYPYQPEGP